MLFFSAQNMNYLLQRVGSDVKVSPGDIIGDEFEILFDAILKRIEDLEIAVSNLTEETFGVDEP